MNMKTVSSKLLLAMAITCGTPLFAEEELLLDPSETLADENDFRGAVEGAVTASGLKCPSGADPSYDLLTSSSGRRSMKLSCGKSTLVTIHAPKTSKTADYMKKMFTSQLKKKMAQAEAPVAGPDAAGKPDAAKLATDKSDVLAVLAKATANVPAAKVPSMPVNEAQVTDTDKEGEFWDGKPAQAEQKNAGPDKKAAVAAPADPTAQLPGESKAQWRWRKFNLKNSERMQKSRGGQQAVATGNGGQFKSSEVCGTKQVQRVLDNTGFQGAQPADDGKGTYSVVGNNKDQKVLELKLPGDKSFASKGAARDYCELELTKQLEAAAKTHEANAKKEGLSPKYSIDEVALTKYRSKLEDEVSSQAKAADSSSASVCADNMGDLVNRVAGKAEFSSTRIFEVQKEGDGRHKLTGKGKDDKQSVVLVDFAPIPERQFADKKLALKYCERELAKQLVAATKKHHEEVSKTPYSPNFHINEEKLNKYTEKLDKALGEASAPAVAASKGSADIKDYRQKASQLKEKRGLVDEVYALVDSREALESVVEGLRKRQGELEAMIQDIEKKKGIGRELLDRVGRKVTPASLLKSSNADLEARYTKEVAAQNLPAKQAKKIVMGKKSDSWCKICFEEANNPFYPRGCIRESEFLIQCSGGYSYVSRKTPPAAVPVTSPAAPAGATKATEL